MRVARVDDKAQVRLIVRGRVQGVFFRGATVEEARSLGLTGWVRNLPDGSVEIVAEGKSATLRMLIAWAHVGPPAARVDELVEEWSAFSAQYQDFRTRR